MQDDQYQQAASVTLSKQFHGKHVSVTALRETLKAMIYHGNQLDAVKKRLFYGKGIVNEDLPTMYNLQDLTLTEKQKDIIHCIIGKATEAVEMLEALEATFASYEKTGSFVFDTVNLGEEMGDGFWYDANLANALGITFGSIKELNIAKLRKRYSDKFDAFEAQNRDLAAERAILEGNHE